MILRPIAFCDNENHVGVTLFVVFVQSPDEVSRVDQPCNVQHQQVTQRKCNKDRSLHGITPVFQRGVDWQQDEQDRVEQPVETLLEHDNFVGLEIAHVDLFEQFLLSRAELADVGKHLSMQEVLVTVVWIIRGAEFLVV